MKNTTTTGRAENSNTHTLLSEEERHAIRVTIERYKQTGKLVSLKEFVPKRIKK